MYVRIYSTYILQVHQSILCVIGIADLPSLIGTGTKLPLDIYMCGLEQMQLPLYVYIHIQIHTYVHMLTHSVSRRSGLTVIHSSLLHNPFELTAFLLRFPLVMPFL